MNSQTTAKALGWFSIALGLTEILAAKRLAQFLHMEDRAGLLRSYGFREIATGVGILSVRNRGPWLWARVGGDVLDLLALTTAVKEGGKVRKAPIYAAAAVAGVTALDVICSQQLGRAQA